LPREKDDDDDGDDDDDDDDNVAGHGYISIDFKIMRTNKSMQCCRAIVVVIVFVVIATVC